MGTYDQEVEPRTQLGDDDSRAQLAAVLSHDAREALSALVLLADALGGAVGESGEPPDSIAARRFTGRIHHEVNRLSELVGSLIELTQQSAAAAPADTPKETEHTSVAPNGIKVLLIDADSTGSEALGFLLSQEGFSVSIASSGLAGLDTFVHSGADVVLVDNSLPDMPGTQVSRALRGQSPVPIIMLSAKDSEVDTVLGLELGADDYLLKPYPPRELLARIRAVLRRGTPTAVSQDGDPTIHVGPVRLDPARHTATVRGEPIRLRLKEFELLALLLRNAGRVLTRGQLIDRVWGTDYVGDTKTLDVHIKRLRDKLEPDPANPQHLVTVRGLGYKFEA